MSHNVVAIDVPNAPAVMRAKFDKPDADGILSGVKPDIVSVTKGINKNAIAMPWIKVGIKIVSISALVLKRERIYKTSAKNKNEVVANLRGSIMLTFLPTQGDKIIANNPTGAKIMPAWVAV